MSQIFIIKGTRVWLTPKQGKNTSLVEKPVVVKRHMGSNVIVTEEDELYDLDDYDFKVVVTCVAKALVQERELSNLLSKVKYESK